MIRRRPWWHTLSADIKSGMRLFRMSRREYLLRFNDQWEARQPVFRTVTATTGDHVLWTPYSTTTLPAPQLGRPSFLSGVKR